MIGEEVELVLHALQISVAPHRMGEVLLILSAPVRQSELKPVRLGCSTDSWAGAC